MAYDIAVIGGDGIGPEIVREGLRVLRAIAEMYGFEIRTVEYPWGGDHYAATEVLMPSDGLDELKQMDAILLGAIGDPRFERGLLERAIISGVRFGLDLYLNLRPIKLYAEHLCPLKGKQPEDIDFTVVRENTEGAYTLIGGNFKQSTPDEVALQNLVYTRKGTERAIRYAFELCRARDDEKRLTLVDKANAVPAHDIWRRTFAEVGEEYPDIQLDYAYVDACCMWFIKNPEWFDTIVCPNLVGDIITDLAAMLQGGLGIAASGNIHPGQVSMFEPIHGSAPKYKGKNVANPIATIMAVRMMLDFLGQTEAAQHIEDAVGSLLHSKRIPDLSARSGLKTDQIGTMVIEALRAATV